VLVETVSDLGLRRNTISPGESLKFGLSPIHRQHLRRGASNDNILVWAVMRITATPSAGSVVRQSCRLRPEYLVRVSSWTVCLFTKFVNIIVHVDFTRLVDICRGKCGLRGVFWEPYFPAIFPVPKCWRHQVWKITICNNGLLQAKQLAS